MRRKRKTRRDYTGIAAVLTGVAKLIQAGTLLIVCLWLIARGFF